MAITWNPSDKSANITLSGGNLTAASATTSWKNARATVSKSAGKWYFEGHLDVMTGFNFQMGWETSAEPLTGYIGVDTHGWSGGYGGGNNKWYNGTGASLSVTFVTGDVFGVALDFTAGYIWFAKNNTWFSSGNPGAGTNPTFSSVSGTLFPAVAVYDNTAQITVNFGATTFAYTAPTGFSGLDSPLATGNFLAFFRKVLRQRCRRRFALSPGGVFAPVY